MGGLGLGVNGGIDHSVLEGEDDRYEMYLPFFVDRSQGGGSGLAEQPLDCFRWDRHQGVSPGDGIGFIDSLTYSGYILLLYDYRYTPSVLTKGEEGLPENFLWKGRFGPMNLLISDTTFRPSTITTLIAKELRIDQGEVAIDVGCGSGVLAIIAAKLGAKHVHAIDKSPDVIEVGRANAEKNDVADRITFYQGDLFEPLDENLQADVIIGDVSGIPDTLADESGWFPTKGGGGSRGSELPIRMLEEARRRLSSGGRLFLPTGSLQDESSIIDAARRLYTRVRKLTERAIPLPNKLASSQVLSELVERGVVRISTRGSRSLWEARVWEVSGLS